MYTLIDGKSTAANIRAQLKSQTAAFFAHNNREVGLAVVLVGENPASQVYVRNKIKACAEVGVKSFAYYLPENAGQAEVEELVASLAADNAVDGILVQLPLPKHLNSQKILSLIPDNKDVDGFSAQSIGKLCKGENTLAACTPLGVMKLLEQYNIPVAGKRAVVVGRSNIVGKPMAMLLLNADATVTICHSKTKNLADEVRRADIVVAAVGKAKFITADVIKEGATVIDVGMNRD